MKTAIGIFIDIFFIALPLSAILLILLVMSNRCGAEDLIIHTDNNVYYYPDADKQETIVLPNNEVIETDPVFLLESNEEPYQTNEGIEIYNAYDNQYFMEGCGENCED